MDRKKLLLSVLVVGCLQYRVSGKENKEFRNFSARCTHLFTYEVYIYIYIFSSYVETYLLRFAIVLLTSPNIMPDPNIGAGEPSTYSYMFDTHSLPCRQPPTRVRARVCVCAVVLYLHACIETRLFTHAAHQRRDHG